MKQNVVCGLLRRGSIATVLPLVLAGYSYAADMGTGVARYQESGELEQPQGFREWVFIGAPLTPNALNGGSAAFPEFHHVYIDPGAYAEYKRTGEFPEGTVIAKELVLLKKGEHPDGSYNAPSGRGFFAGKYQGLDVMVKDSKRYHATNGWGFFNFTHEAPPYAASAKALPADKCAFCHQGNAEKDMLFTQFYPLLRDR